jgi:hypothetical protein
MTWATDLHHRLPVLSPTLPMSEKDDNLHTRWPPQEGEVQDIIAMHNLYEQNWL